MVPNLEGGCSACAEAGDAGNESLSPKFGIPGLRSSRALLLLAFMLGLFSMAMQALTFREHSLAYSGNEVGASLFLASWIFWSAIGALAGRLLLAIARPSTLIPLFLTYLPAAALQLVLVWSMRQMAGLEPYQPFPMDLLALWTLIVTMPLSLLTGALFVITVALRSAALEPAAAPTNVGNTFALEALGGAVGGVVASLLFGAGAAPHLVLSLVGALWLLGVAAVVLMLRRRLLALAAVVLLIPTCAILLPQSANLTGELRLQAAQLPPNFILLDQFDTWDGHAVVATYGDQTMLFSNGELSALYPDGGRSMFRASALASLAGPEARTLVLGSGNEELVAELANRLEPIVTWVPHIHGLYQRLLPFLHGELAAALNPQEVRIQEEEPGAFLLGTNQEFDLLVLGFPDATGTASGRFLTQSFLESVTLRLSAEGIVAADLPLPDASVSGPAVDYASAVRATLLANFPEVTVLAGMGRLHLFACKTPGRCPSSADALVQRARELPTLPTGYHPEQLFQLFEERLSQRWSSILGHLSHPPLSEERPSAYMLHLRTMQGESRLLRLLDAPSSYVAKLTLLLALALLAAWLIASILEHGRRPFPRVGEGEPALLLAAGGFVGMVLHLTLMLAFQLRFGTLHVYFAVLNAAFMAGMGLTPLVASRLPASGLASRIARGPGAAAALLVASLVVSGLLAWKAAALGAFLLASLAVGTLGGLALVLGSSLLYRASDSRAGVGAAFQFLDSSGALLGALVAGLFWVPAVGFSKTAGMALLLAVVVLLVQTAAVAGLVGTTRLRAEPQSGGQTDSRLQLPNSLLLRIFLFLIFVAFTVHLLDKRAEATRTITPVEAPSIPGETESAQPDGVPPLRTVATLELAPGVSGYGGPIAMSMTVDSTERIVSLELGEHNETPEYTSGLELYLGEFIGKHAPELVYGAAGDSGVDALTGATVTGQAVVSAVRIAGRKLEAQRMETQRRIQPLPPANRDSDGQVERGAGEAFETGGATTAVALEGWEPGEFGLQPGALVVALLGLLGIGLYLVPRRAVRLAYLLLVTCVGGLWLNSQLTLGELLRWIWGGMPAANQMLLATLGVALLAMLLFGNLFCGYLCPFGALQELISSVGLSWRVRDGVERRLRALKYVVAILAMLLALLAGVDVAFGFDVLRFAFSMRWDPLALALLLLVLLASLLWHRPWCRFMCPTGALFSLGNRVALLDALGPRRTYHRCHLGVRNQLELDCVRCNRCAQLPQPRVRYWSRKPSEVLLLLFVTVALVLGTARSCGPWLRGPGDSGTAISGAPNHGVAAGEPSSASEALNVNGELLNSKRPPSAELPGQEPAMDIPRHEPGRSARGPGVSQHTVPQAAGEASGGAGLLRTENSQHGVQRDVDMQRLREMFLEGKASKREALFYLPVP